MRNDFTHFVIDWIEYQMEQFPSIEGILLLDDIVGFVGDFTATIERYAGTYGRPVMVVLGVLLLGILGTMLWRRLTGSPQDAPSALVDDDAIDELVSKQLEDSLN